MKKVCNFEFDCDDMSDEKNCGTCDFEDTWCGWYDKSEDALRWSRKQAPSFLQVGPQVDHTLNSSAGHYLITEVTGDQGGWFDNAVLLGPNFQATGESCKMVFWLHMGGTRSQELNIFYTNSSNYLDSKFLKQIDGPLGPDWKKFEIFIGKQPGDYQVDFVSDLSNPGKSQIAIDDVEFIDCALSYVSSDQSLNCDFENGLCNYYPDESSDFYWKRGDGSDYNGPGFDHTTGTGYFIYVDSFYPQKSGDEARITSSKQTKVNKEFCFTFWYHMFGSRTGSLNVYVDKFIEGSENYNRTKMWERDGTQGNQWNKQSLTLLSSTPWKVTLEGKLF